MPDVFPVLAPEPQKRHTSPFRTRRAAAATRRRPETVPHRDTAGSAENRFCARICGSHRPFRRKGIRAMDMSVWSMLAQATPVAQAVLVLLLLMSIGSWALMFGKWFALRAAASKASEGMDRFDRARDLRAAVQSLGADATSPLYAVAHEGVTEFNRAREAGNAEDVVADNVRRALDRGVGKEISRLGGSLSMLATTANTAPFIGLFGTVWGIMHTFHSIGAMKSASLATVAPGISEALIATAVGLAAAIPASVGYNSFQSRLVDIEVRLNNFAGMFLNCVQRELHAGQAVRPGAPAHASGSGA